MLLMGLAVVLFPVFASAQSADTLGVRMVEIERDILIEVIDWGGTGTEVVLLAGLGNTAHVYEDFGRSLAQRYHVYALTRRGFGASTHANGGYAPPDLARDVALACDSLGIANPVLIGHGLAGTEMAWFAARYPGRARGMVFLDAAYDHSLIHEMEDLASKPQFPLPEASDLRSLRSAQAWLLRTRGFATPVAELEALYYFGSQGQVADMASSPLARGLLLDALRTPPYVLVDEPTLAIFVKPTVDSLYPDLDEFDPENRILVEPRVALNRQLMSAAAATFEKKCPQAQVMIWEGVNHHLFLTETSDVLVAVRAFIDALPPPAVPDILIDRRIYDVPGD